MRWIKLHRWYRYRHDDAFIMKLGSVNKGKKKEVMTCIYNAVTEGFCGKWIIKCISEISYISLIKLFLDIT